LELQREGGYWVEIVSKEVLHAKINTSMYDHNRRLTTRGEQQNSESESFQFLGDANKRQKRDDNGNCRGGCI
jgi:hypothetical protein